MANGMGRIDTCISDCVEISYDRNPGSLFTKRMR